MKTSKIILSVIFAVMSAFSMVAHDVTPIKSENLSSEQKNTLQYAKKILKAQENKIALPLEVNALIGDTVSPEPYIAVALLDEAYFLSDTVFETSLIVPLKATTPNGEILSNLKILGADKYTFCRVVTTEISFMPSESSSYSVDVDSNLDGVMLVTSIYEKDELKGRYEGVSSSFGVVDCTYESNYDFDMNTFREFHTTIESTHLYKNPESKGSHIDNLFKKVIEIQANAKRPIKYVSGPFGY